MNEFEYIGEWVEVKCANDGTKFIVDKKCWDSYLKDYKWISCFHRFDGQTYIQTSKMKYFIRDFPNSLLLQEILLCWLMKI